MAQTEYHTDMAGLREMSGKPQAEREANCQMRLAKHRAMTPGDQHKHTFDGLNYSFQGGFGGVFYGAKRNKDDDRLPADVRALYRQGVDYAYAAFAADKAGKTDLATHFAVQATAAVSKATGMMAMGWVGDAGGVP